MEAVAQTKEVAARIAKQDFTGALSLRDPEFEECLEAFYATTRLDQTRRVPEAQRMRVGIIQYANPSLDESFGLISRQCGRTGRRYERCNKDSGEILSRSRTYPAWYLQWLARTARRQCQRAVLVASRSMDNARRF